MHIHAYRLFTALCAALWIAGRTRPACVGLTFEVTPTAEAGGVSPRCEDVRGPQRGLTTPAVVGRGVERGVRQHFGAGRVCVTTLEAMLP